MEIANVKKINQLDSAAGLPTGKKNKNLLATITDPDTGKTYKGTLKELLEFLIPPSTSGAPSLLIPRGEATTTPQEGLSNVGGELFFLGKPLRSNAIIKNMEAGENLDTLKQEGMFGLWSGYGEIQGLPSNITAEYLGYIHVYSYKNTWYQEMVLHANRGADGVYIYYRYSSGTAWSKYAFVKANVLP